MILYFGTKYKISIVPEGSRVVDNHRYAVLQAYDCRATGCPKVYFIEAEPDEIRFVEEIGYLRRAKEPVGWHRVGR